MVKITYIAHGGKEHVIEAATCISLMQNAIRNDVSGIDAECGGAFACATCHVYIEESWQAATGKPDIMEQSMLEFAVHVQPNSRLSCQIAVTEMLDGIIVRIPISQS